MSFHSRRFRSRARALSLRDQARARTRAGLALRAISALVPFGIAALLVSCTGGGAPPPSSSPPTTQVVTSASPPAFSFSSARIAPEPVVAGRGISAGTKAGRAIQTALTGFYQSAFADPSLWGQDLPSAAWDVFASDVRTRAQRDADTLTLGTLGRGVERLTFTRKDLVVRVLIDQSGRAEAALATVTVEADANTTDGQSFVVSNHVTFFLEPSRDAWLINGYPNAKTTGAPAA